MKDPEFKELLHKAIIIAVIVLLIIITVFFLFYNKMMGKQDDVLKNIKKEKTFVVYIIKNNCKNCDAIKKEISNIKYNELREGNKEYIEIINKLGLEDSNIKSSALIYIKKGKTYSYIVDMQEKQEIKNFIKNNKLQ